ncbi:MAG TPA: hypothetical protein VKP69_04445 [Isosphaeraceae bacterium]|nr:hypothetical protein [Isosphaeraceae bacterium]
MHDPSPIDPREDSVYSESSDPGIPPVIYRAGKPNPGNLKPRAIDNGKLSFRDSLSNPLPRSLEDRPVFPIGESYFGVDPSRLPPGTVVRDDDPPGHLVVGEVSPDVLREAVVERGKFPA